MQMLSNTQVDRSEPMRATLEDVIDALQDMQTSLDDINVFSSYRHLAYRCICGYVNHTGDTKSIMQYVRQYEALCNEACKRNR